MLWTTGLGLCKTHLLLPGAACGALPVGGAKADRKTKGEMCSFAGFPLPVSLTLTKCLHSDGGSLFQQFVLVAAVGSDFLVSSFPNVLKKLLHGVLPS